MPYFRNLRRALARPVKTDNDIMRVGGTLAGGGPQDGDLSSGAPSSGLPAMGV